MTASQFGAIMTYLEDAVQKPISKKQADVYWDLLRDVPPALLLEACRRAVLENEYPTIPTPAVLRRLALEAVVAQQMTATEAWGLVRQAMIAPPLERKRLRSEFPALVARVVDCLGWERLCAGDVKDTGTLYSQFAKAFEALATREKRQQLLPPPPRKELERIAGPLVNAQLAQIGVMPDDTLTNEAPDAFRTDVSKQRGLKLVAHPDH